MSGKWRNSREREKAETLNLSGFLPFIAQSGYDYVANS